MRPRRLGILTPADGVYKFTGAETGLLPDVGFYVAERDALIRDKDKPIPFTPDLAIEVALPSQDASDTSAKARTYLDGGTRLVWIVWPLSGHIDVWHPDDKTGSVDTLNMSDTLDGEDVIPGFLYPVAGVFADPLA